MLLLLFYLGDVMYAMKCKKIREVVPLVKLKEVAHTPDFLAGIFNYRGVVVPVIDLRMLVQSRPCEMRLSTRIIIVDYLKEDGTPFVVGLMAERVTETVKRPENAFASQGLDVEGAPYLGGFLMENHEMIQYMDLDMLQESFRFLPMIGGGHNVPEKDRITA